MPPVTSAVKRVNYASSPQHSPRLDPNPEPKSPTNNRKCTRSSCMKIGICALGALMCFAYMAQAMLTPSVIEAVLAKTYQVNTQDASLISKAARVQSLLDGLQCLLFLFVAPAIGMDRERIAQYQHFLKGGFLMCMEGRYCCSLPAYLEVCALQSEHLPTHSQPSTLHF